MQQADLIAAIGITDADAVCTAWGGRTVRVPKDPVRLRAHIPDLSEDGARRFAAFAGGSLEYFGRAVERRRARNARIRLEYSRGESLASLAGVYGLCERQIANILKEFDKCPIS